LTYIEIKNILVSIISSTRPEVIKIGGTGIRVQIDETAICNGLVVSNPSNRYDIFQKFSG
jgi:hypothetical protein